MVAKYRKILSNFEEDSAHEVSTKQGTSSSHQPTNRRLVTLSASKLEAMRSDLAQAQEQLLNLQDRYNVQGKLVAMLVHSSTSQQMDRAIIEENNEQLRQTAEGYKQDLHTAQQINVELEQYIKDINIHASFLETTNKELTEKSELLQDQLALAYLIPFIQQGDDITKEEAFSLEEEFLEIKYESEDTLGYAFMARTYCPTPVSSAPSLSSLPSPSTVKIEWDDDADLWDIITNMPIMGPVDPSQLSSNVILAYGAINVCVGLPVLPTLTEQVQFVPDSGATNHTVSDADYLTQSIIPVKGSPSVRGIDGKSLDVMATGSMSIRDYKGSELLLTEVLLVPVMQVNVISVSKLTSIGLSCIFQGNSFRVEGGNDHVLYESVVNGVFTSSSVIRSIYSDAPRSHKAVDRNGVHCFAVSFECWHQRLVHPSTHVLQQLVTQDAAIGLGVLSSNDMPRLCLPCLKAKQKRVSHSTSQSVANCVLQLIHCDLMGPLPKSYGGSQYILAVLDDYSRFSRIECIEHKSDATESLTAIIRLWEREAKCKVQIVRTDGGKEFCNQHVYSFCRSQGIRHQRTVPYAPEQNGKVERLNRDLMEKARAMMFHCGAPAKLWAEAVATANRVRNVLPQMNKAITPFELVYGRKPNFSSLKVFGCMAYVHVPKEKRKKLDARSETGMFVGFSVDSKAWRIAFQVRNYIKIVESDSFIFDESTLGALSVCSPPRQREDADHVDINLNSMGETIEHPAPDANAARNFDVNHLPPLPSLNDEEIAALLDPSTNEVAAEEAAVENSTAKGIPDDPVQAEGHEDQQEAESQVNNPVGQEQAQEEE
jgi:hypothetical protein